MRRGFSLVELLVVMAIIVILAGLVVPATGLVKGAAKTMRCQGNLRQILIGAYAYAEDNEVLPPAILWHSNGQGDKYWMGFLAPYMESTPQDSTQIWKIRTTSVIYGCPEYTWTPGFPTSVGYGMTPYPSAPAKQTINQSDDLPVNSAGYVYHLFQPNEVTHASERPYVADSSNWSLPASSIVRHRGRLGVAFFDGHVGSQSYAVISNGVKNGVFAGD